MNAKQASKWTQIIGVVIICSALLTLFEVFRCGWKWHELLLMAQIGLAIGGGIGLIRGRSSGFYCVVTAWVLGMLSSLLSVFLGADGPFSFLAIAYVWVPWAGLIHPLITNAVIVGVIWRLRKVAESNQPATDERWFTLNSCGVRVGLRLLIGLSSLAVLCAYLLALAIGLALSGAGTADVWLACIPLISFLLLGLSSLPTFKPNTIRAMAVVSFACVILPAIHYVRGRIEDHMPGQADVSHVLIPGSIYCCLAAVLFWIAYQLAKKSTQLVSGVNSPRLTE